MELVRILRSAVMRRAADLNRREALRARAEQRRHQEGRPHEVLYFHQVDDPYSQLAAQALSPPPAPSWIDFARRLALAAETDAAQFIERIPRIDRALQQGSMTALNVLAAGQPPMEAAAARTRLEQNFRLRHRLGHYLGGMFQYQGEWYWGTDRLPYLEDRLDALGLRRRDAPAGRACRAGRRPPRALIAPHACNWSSFPPCAVRTPISATTALRPFASDTRWIWCCGR